MNDNVSARDVVPIGEPIARVNVGCREQRLHRRFPSDLGRPSISIALAKAAPHLSTARRALAIVHADMSALGGASLHGN
jgi:hypothetical protein